MAVFLRVIFGSPKRSIRGGKRLLALPPTGASPERAIATGLSRFGPHYHGVLQTGHEGRANVPFGVRMSHFCAGYSYYSELYALLIIVIKYRIIVTYENTPGQEGGFDFSKKRDVGPSLRGDSASARPQRSGRSPGILGLAPGRTSPRALL